MHLKTAAGPVQTRNMSLASRLTTEFIPCEERNFHLGAVLPKPRHRGGFPGTKCFARNPKLCARGQPHRDGRCLRSLAFMVLWEWTTRRGFFFTGSCAQHITCSLQLGAEETIISAEQVTGGSCSSDQPSRRKSKILNPKVPKGIPQIVLSPYKPDKQP